MLSAEPKAEADNTYLDLDYLDITKTESNCCFIIHCSVENDNKHTVARNLIYTCNIVVGINHALQCNLQITSSQLSASR